MPHVARVMIWMSKGNLLHTVPHS